MNWNGSKKSLALSGVLLALVAAVLAFTGTPKNMAICGPALSAIRRER